MTASDTCMYMCRLCDVVSTPASMTSPHCSVSCMLTTSVMLLYATIQHDLLIAGQPWHYVELVHVGYLSFYMCQCFIRVDHPVVHFTVRSLLHRLGSESIQDIGGRLRHPLNVKSSLHVDVVDDPGQCVRHLATLQS